MQSPAAKHPTVLIVDDDQDVCSSLKNLVNALGMKAEFICEPTRVLDRVKETHYDLMLLDVMMPGMSGLDLLPRVLEAAPAIKVIMVTGNGDQRTAAESRRLGAFDFLQKPVRVNSLSNAIRRALEKGASG